MTKCHSKDILERYKDNTIKFYLYILKNMESLEKNAGILTKDFIKKLVNREKELENTIFELGEKIKALKSSENNKENDIPKGYDIFLRMMKYAAINLQHNEYDNLMTLSIDGCPIRTDEMEYIQRLIKEQETEYTSVGIGKHIKRTYIMPTCVKTNVGTEGSSGCQYTYNWDIDRSW